MTLRDFRIGWRLLLSEPGYSSAVVFGLAVGFAACFLILGLVRYAFSYNAAIAGSDHIYIVKERRNLLPRPDWRPTAPALLVGVAQRSGMPLQATSAKQFDLTARVDARFVPLALKVADANFLDFFGVRAIEGDARAALARPDALAISRETAIRLFGEPHAIGKLLHIDGAAFTVRAILPDMPANSTVTLDALLGAGAHSWDPPSQRAGADWFRTAQVYVKAARGVSAADLAALLQEAVTARDARFGARLRGSPDRPATDIAVVPLSKVYFDPDLLAGRAGGRYGSRAGVLGLAALAILILVLASANYVNLAAVRTLGRQREIGVRKVLGVSGARLARQFIAESLVVALLAALLGLLVAWLALPLFSELVGRRLEGMFTFATALAMLGLGALTGVLSGLYPAWLALRLPASVTLQGRGNGETASGLRLRRVLSVFQFGVAISLVAATLAVVWQARYASRADPGFDPAPLLVVSLPGDGKSAAAHAFQAELARLPELAGVAAVQEAPGRDGNKSVIMVGRPGAEPVPMELKDVGPTFFSVYRIAPVAGKLFDPGQVAASGAGVVLNARGAAALGFASPEAAVGQMFDQSDRIIGIAPDVRFQNLRTQPGPIAYRLDPHQAVLTVRAAASVGAARAAVEALWPRHFPNDPPDVEAAASVFAQNYSEDLRLAKLLAAASVVATALASFGIYVLAAYTVKRRAREIVLRKLHGARGRDIGRLVAREFAVLIGVGALAGLPLAWLGIERYLAGFVERAPMGAWPMMYSLLLVGLVAVGATCRQTLAAVRMPPALALRQSL
jgi:ABC-type lipoprotein release transport system permease subunit